MISLLQQRLPSGKPFILITTVIAINVAVWIFSVTFFSFYSSSMLSYLIIAYSLGLRHALDWDHIAAIDNVTRRFIQSGQMPVTIGLFFSLGHSTIVIVATVAVAALSSTIMDTFDSLGNTTGIVGSAISAAFLFLIGLINSVSIYYIIQALKALHSEAESDSESGNLNNWDEIIQKGGLFTRMFGSCLFKIIDKTWKMYFVGVLFGLGFDTSTEIAILGIAFIQSQNHVSTWLIIFLSIKFTIGMTLIDSIDSICMLKVYGWASISPEQKLHYNLIITTMSFVFAMSVAIIGLLGIFQTVYALDDNVFWAGVGSAGGDDNPYLVGTALFGAFLLGWLFSLAMWRLYPSKSQEIKNANEGNVHSDSDALQISASEVRVEA